MTNVKQLLSPPEPWADSAACAHPSVDPRWFWEPAKQVDAKRVCVGCPVVDDCLQVGMSQEYGIWGGYTPAERRRIQRGENPGPVIVETDFVPVPGPIPEPPPGDLTREERKEWARLLREQHKLTHRKIAEKLKVGKTTVERWLKETAA